MRQTEFIPIYVFITIAIFCGAFLIIEKIRNKHSVLHIENKDFIQKVIEKKKRALDSNLGAFSFNTYITLIFGLPILVGLIGWFTMTDKAMAIILALSSVFTPDLYLKATEERQDKLFQVKYARALRAFASCLRSNMTIQQAVQEVAENPFIDESIKKGFRQIDSDIKVGLSVKQAFKRFAEDSKSVDAMDVYSAIAMQSEVGGSEAKIINTITNNIQDRLMLQKEIKTLFAETDVMIGVFDIIPIVVVIILYYGAPQLITPFFESNMMITLFATLVFTMVIGSFYIRKRVSRVKGGEI